MTAVSGISRNFTFTHRITNSTLEGISQEESLLPPPNGGNCINWIMGHIVHTRDVILKQLGEQEVWTDSEAKALYERGSSPLTESGNALKLSVLLELYNQTQPRILEGIERLGNSPTSDGKLEDTIAFFNFHESYHLGQLAILRRILGKDSVIK
ncbi:MAG: DinB family protein [Bacteroidetes bacterium]|nr:DinB family protein [Bacteroidota bacterium]